MHLMQEWSELSRGFGLANRTPSDAAGTIQITVVVLTQLFFCCAESLLIFFSNSFFFLHYSFLLLY